jgi:hypothetical protein
MKFQPRETSIELIDGVPLSSGQVFYPREASGLYLDTNEGTRQFYPFSPAICTVANLDSTNRYQPGSEVGISTGIGFNFADWINVGTVLRIQDKGMIQVTSISDNWLKGRVIVSEFRMPPVSGDIITWVSAKCDVTSMVGIYISPAANDARPNAAVIQALDAEGNATGEIIQPALMYPSLPLAGGNPYVFAVKQADVWMCAPVIDTAAMYQRLTVLENAMDSLLQELDGWRLHVSDLTTSVGYVDNGLFQLEVVDLTTSVGYTVE